MSRRTVEQVERQLRVSSLRCKAYRDAGDERSAAIERRVQDRLLDERNELTA